MALRRKKKHILDRVGLKDIREAFAAVNAYWEKRAEVDFFFDGTKEWDLAKEGLALMDKYEEAGYDTGKRELHRPKRLKEED